MNEMQGRIWDILCNLDGESVARLFTNFHGNQLLTREFAEFMIDEGCCDAWELGMEDYENEEERKERTSVNYEPDEYYE